MHHPRRQLQRRPLAWILALEQRGKCVSWTQNRKGSHPTTPALMSPDRQQDFLGPTSRAHVKMGHAGGVEGLRQAQEEPERGPARRTVAVILLCLGEKGLEGLRTVFPW